MRKIISIALMGFSLIGNALPVDEWINKDQFESANKAVETDMMKSPNEPLTYLNYAKVMLAKNEIQKSWAGITQARKLIDSIAYSKEKKIAYEKAYYQTKGVWYFQKKLFKKSADSFKESLKLDKKNLETNLWLLTALWANNNFQEVDTVLLNAHAVFPKNETVNYLYQINEVQRHFSKKSEKNLQKLIKSYPHLAAPKILMVNLYIKEKKYDLAKKVLENVQPSEWLRLPIETLSAQIALSLNQPQEVIKNLSMMVPENEDFQLLAWLSFSYASLGDFDQANIFFEKSLKARSHESFILLESSLKNIESQNIVYFDKLMVNYFQQKQFDLYPGLVKISYFFKKNQLGDAQKEAINWVKLYPAQAFAYDILGYINKSEGNYSRAETAFRSAIKLNEVYLPARLHLVDLLIKQRRYYEARDLLSSTVKKFKPDSKIFLLWSKLEELEGNHNAAKKWLEKAASIEPNLEPGLEFVSFYLRQNRPKLALLLAESLAKSHGEDIRLLHLLGGLYLESTYDYQRAISIYKKLALFLPEAPGVIQNLSKSYELSGHPEAAINILERYLDKYPKHTELKRKLVQLYFYHKNLEVNSQG